MTQAEIEKQAEEYTEKNGEKYNAHLSSKRMIYLSFQDGAKWGMEHAIEWHDLRKYPDDLPKEKGIYWVYCYSLEYEKLYYMAVPYNARWGTLYKVIAWCELPQFKE